MVANPLYSDDHEDQDSEPIHFHGPLDLAPTPRNYVRWYDGTLYRKGWRDEDVEPSDSCSYRCYVSRYINPGDDHRTMMAVRIHDPATHEEYGYYKLRYQREQQPSGIFVTTHLAFDFDRMELRVDGALIDLTMIESEIFYILVSSYAKLVTREELIGSIWGKDDRLVDRPGRKDKNLTCGSKKLTVNMSRLRTKLDSDSERFIRTRKYTGYLLEDDDERR